MSIFSAYMAKYCDTRQHKLNRLSHLRERAQDMYSKVQVDSQIPQLDKDLEEAQLKWTNLAKERADLVAEVKKVSKLKVELDELKQNILRLCNVHQAEVKGLHTAHQVMVERLHGLHSEDIECKNSFCEVERVRVLSKV